MPEQLQNNVNSYSVNNGNSHTVLIERGFCAYSTKDGGAIKIESNDVKSFRDIDKEASVCWIDFSADNIEKDFVQIATSLGFSEQLVSNLLKNKRSGYEDFGNEMGILLPAVTGKGFDVKLNVLLILIHENTVLTLHPAVVKRFLNLRKYAQRFLQKLPANTLTNDKITSLLIRLIDENNNRNFDHLLEIEQQGDKLSEYLSDCSCPRDKIGAQIHEMRHALITYLGALWATVDVLSSTRYGDPDLLSDDVHILDKITGLMADVNSQIGLSEHLSEVLASGLEVVQSIYNNQLQIYNNQLQLLNNKMALLVGYLTIIGTALLVPNTIATALSCPVFNFLQKKDITWYMSLIVISTIVSTFLAWYVVKKAGLLPKRADRDE